ncbi:MAG: hypothetical protein U0547_12335 [Dehalococcoidia bacterium]
MSVLPDGRVLIAGGFPNGVNSDIYSPATNTLTPTGYLQMHHTRHGAAVLDDGRVLVAGGYQGCMTSAAEVFNPSTATWSYTNGMITARADFTLVKLADGRVLAAGGDNDCAAPRKTRNAEVYNPATSTWTAVAPMNIPRAHYAAALMPDGRVLFVSGDNDAGMTASAEIYDPVANTWTLTPELHRPRFFSIGEGILALPDGRMLVAGSDAFDTPVTSSETYDPATNTWSAPLPMSDSHCHGALTRLASGEPVLIGGAHCRDNSVQVLSAEFLSIHVDTTPPVLAASATQADGSAYAFGTWARRAVTVHFTCTDEPGGSGVASVSGDVTVSSEGITVVYGTCFDAAGHGVASSDTVQVDFTAPSFGSLAQYAVPVPAREPWWDTAIDISAGSTLSVTASGLIYNSGSGVGVDPSGRTSPNQVPGTQCGGFLVPDAGCWSLVGRIGQGPAFPVGMHTTITAAAAGRLYLSVNDDYFGDNSGAWQATISVTTAGIRYLRADGTTYTPGTSTSQPVTVLFQCSDTLSGVASCPAGMTFGADGSYSGTVTATDRAGNATSLSYGPVLIDNTGADITLHLVDHAGVGIAGGTASAYYGGAWHAIPGVSGPDGRLPATGVPRNAGLAIAMTLNGSRQQLNLGQLTSSNFTFQTVAVAVRLQDHAGAPLNTGSASYYAGSWRAIGATTGGIAMVELLPGSYSFAMVYNGTRQQLDGQDIAANPTVTFATRLITIELRNHSGDLIDTGTPSYYAGSWRTLPVTDGGRTSVEMLPGSYSFAMVYNGTRLQLNAMDIAANPTVTFQTVLVTVELRDQAGNLVAGTGAPSYYAGSWRPISDTVGGLSAVEMLPGTYSFAMVYLGTRQQADARTIAPNSVVIFSTSRVHSTSNTATAYYAGGAWRPFTQDMQLLPGTYTFRFASGPNRSFTLTGGTVTTID